MGNGNIGNLIPNEERTPEQRRENARKAGLASGARRRADKKLKTLANLILNTTIKSEEDKKILQEQIDGLEDEQVTKGAALLAKIFMKANQKNASFSNLVKAFELLRDTSGQKPVDQQEVAFGNGNIEIKIDGEDVE